MKCAHCNLCLDIYSLEVDGAVRLYHFCDLCLRIYKMVAGNSRLEITDKEEYDSIKLLIDMRRKLG